MKSSRSTQRIKNVRRVSGAGNTFVIVDNWQNNLSNFPEMARVICPAAKTDGLLIAEQPSSDATGTAVADARMRIFNPDGSEAEMCGNGARCFALFISKEHTLKKVRIETMAGVLTADISSLGQVVLEMPIPTELNKLAISVGGVPLEMFTARVGVPHVIVHVPDRHVTQSYVESLGRDIRNHPQFAPAGTNVNFIQRRGERWYMWTYERGVERQTPACGTGAMAVAGVLWRYFPGSLTNGNIMLIPPSGSVLDVRFEIDGNQLQRAWLGGSTELQPPLGDFDVSLGGFLS